MQNSAKTQNTAIGLKDDAHLLQHEASFFHYGTPLRSTSYRYQYRWIVESLDDNYSP
jgi:hypothetical protein